MGRLRVDVSSNHRFKRLITSSPYSRSQFCVSDSGRRGGGSRSTSAIASKAKVTINDALTYLKEVKSTFSDQREKYDMFLDVMNDLKAQRIDTLGVISRVKELFKGYPSLLLGLNPFLPKGYEIILNDEDEAPLKKTIDFDTYGKGFAFCERVKKRLRSTADYQIFLKCLRIYSRYTISRKQLQSLTFMLKHKFASGKLNMNNPIVSNTLGNCPDLMEGFNKFIERYDRDVVYFAGEVTKWDASNSKSKLIKKEKKFKEQKCKTEASPLRSNFEEAINFVKRVKDRFQNYNHVYKSFLDILKMYRNKHKNIDEVYREVAKLFNDHPDLLDDFTKFLPDSSAVVMLKRYIDQLTIRFSSL